MLRFPDHISASIGPIHLIFDIWVQCDSSRIWLTFCHGWLIFDEILILDWWIEVSGQYLSNHWFDSYYIKYLASVWWFQDLINLWSRLIDFWRNANHWLVFRFPDNISASIGLIHLIFDSYVQCDSSQIWLAFVMDDWFFDEMLILDWCWGFRTISKQPFVQFILYLIFWFSVMVPRSD